MANGAEDFSLFEILPDSIAEIREVEAATAAIDPEMMSVSRDIREALILYRQDELPERVIDLLAWQYHVDNYEPLYLALEQKRAQVRDAINLHRRKGTPWALKRELANIGFPTELIEDTGKPYIFNLSVALSAGADIGEVYQAAVRAAVRTKNTRSSLGTVSMESSTLGVLRCASAGYSGARVEIYPWVSPGHELEQTIHAAAAVHGHIYLTIGPA